MERQVMSLLCLSLHLILHLQVSANSPPPASPPSFDWSDDDESSDYPPVAPAPAPAPCNPEDRTTLLQIKLALNNPIHLSNWLPTTDCCNSGWQYVGCDRDSGRVIRLSFNRDDAEHTTLPRILPWAVGNLTYLKSLQFYNNATGHIPPSLANLRDLDSLDLSRNRLSGSIPDYLGRLPLSSLDLSGNRLGGPIPASLGDAPRLWVLNLSHNRLTGPIPSNLLRLSDLNNNQYDVDLSHNRLAGPIPRSFQGVNFRSLILAGNRLTGDPSFLFRYWSGVWHLDLSKNKLAFNMSSVEIPFHFTLVNLRQNRIYGGLPPALSTAGLYEFNVSYNRLCGQIPQGGSLQQFDRTAFFHNKCLCGPPLPAC